LKKWLADVLLDVTTTIFANLILLGVCAVMYFNYPIFHAELLVLAVIKVAAIPLALLFTFLVWFPQLQMVFGVDAEKPAYVTINESYEARTAPVSTGHSLTHR
jgi:hypothetical protein